MGPRLECWYEGRGENASVGGDPATGDALIAPGLELVVLGPAMEAERLELACASL